MQDITIAVYFNAYLEVGTVLKMLIWNGRRCKHGSLNVRSELLIGGVSYEPGLQLRHPRGVLRGLWAPQQADWGAAGGVGEQRWRRPPFHPTQLWPRPTRQYSIHRKGKPCIHSDSGRGYLLLGQAHGAAFRRMVLGPPLQVPKLYSSIKRKVLSLLANNGDIEKYCGLFLHLFANLINTRSNIAPTY